MRIDTQSGLGMASLGSSRIRKTNTGSNGDSSSLANLGLKPTAESRLINSAAKEGGGDSWSPALRSLIDRYC